MKGVPQNVINDYTQNATMECWLHEEMHDVQEKRNIETIIYERGRTRTQQPNRLRTFRKGRR